MMGILFTVFTAIPGLAEKFLDWQVKRANVELEGFKVGASVDLESFKAYLAAQVQTNQMKLVQNSWWGAKLIIMIAGLPCALHFGAVYADSLPFMGHQVGSWGIPKVPSPYDTYQWAIVQSFFVVLPAMPVAKAASQWLGRK